MATCLLPSLLFFLLKHEPPWRFAARHLSIIAALVLAIVLPDLESNTVAHLRASVVAAVVAQPPAFAEGAFVHTPDAIYQMPDSVNTVPTAILMSLVLAMFSCRSFLRASILLGAGAAVGFAGSLAGFFLVVAPLHSGQPPLQSFPREPWALGWAVLLLFSVYLAHGESSRLTRGCS